MVPGSSENLFQTRRRRSGSARTGRQKRAFIVTDRYLFDSGIVNNVTRVLEEMDIDYQIFFDVKPDPTLSTIDEALAMVRPYQPDVFIALGGGSPMDAAKIIWLMYEHPEVNFEDISMRFMDIRKRICSIPELGKKRSWWRFRPLRAPDRR